MYTRLDSQTPDRARGAAPAHQPRATGQGPAAAPGRLERGLGNDYLRATGPDRSCVTDGARSSSTDGARSSGCGLGSCGGCAVNRVQYKLMVGAADDGYEQAADRAADQVLAGSGPVPLALPGPPPPSLQRQCDGCQGCGNLADERDERLQRRADGGAPGPGGGPAPPRAQAAISALRGGGEPLPASERSWFESRFGRDFSQVRVHTDGAAAAAVGAYAFTLGRDVVFGAGQYRPGTTAGRWLLAHELAHVVQQEQAPGRVQRLAITRHAFKKGDCGGRQIQWVFSLSKPAPADGYIVQQIDQYEFVKTCPDVAIGPPAPTARYWEAWLVKKGDKVDWTTTRDSWTDGSPRPPRAGTNGTQISAGTVKFFTRAVTGDLGDFGVAPADAKSAWGPGQVPSSGGLPSTASKPSWWDGTPTEGPVSREAYSNWDCCSPDPAKRTSNVEVTP